MSKPAVLVAVGVAVALGILTLLVLGPGGGGGGSGDGDAAAGPFFELDPSAVESVTVERPGGEPFVLRRVAEGVSVTGSRWVATAVGGDPAVSGWPANGPRIETALGRLERIEAIDGAPSDRAPERSVLRLVFEVDGGASPSRELSFETSAAGGNLLARSGGRSAVIPRASVEQWIDTEPGDWRLRVALPGVGPATTSRLTLLGPAGERVSLSRVEGRWSVRAPVSVAADADAVEGLLDALGALRVAEFGADVPAGEAETLTIVAERDRRAGGGVETERLTARVGGPAPFGVGSRFAEVRFGEAGPFSIAVRGAALASMDGLLDARRYVSGAASSATASDVRFLTVSGGAGVEARGYRRALDTWEEMKPDGALEEVGAETRRGIEGVLEVLSSGEGEVSLVSDLGSLVTPARVELRGADGEVLEVLRVGYSGAGVLTVRSGAVAWRYPDAPEGMAALLGVPEPELVVEPEREPVSVPEGGDDSGAMEGGK